MNTPESLPSSESAPVAPVATVWVVTVPSSYRMGHQCFLGEGASKAAAMADAFGPKPWPRSARNVDCYAVTPDRAQEMRESVNE